MKYVLFFTFMLGMIACQNQEKNQVNIETKVEKPDEQHTVNEYEVGVSPGDYVEYHENGNVKIKGQYDQGNERTGLWISYYDNGIKWSESYYIKGKKDGHSFTFYPNGKIRYRGEYDMDQKTGKWTYYDESGNVTNEENY